MSRASFERLTVPPHQIGQRLAGYVAFSYIDPWGGTTAVTFRKRRLSTVIGQNSSTAILGTSGSSRWSNGS
jgi:hypothetical protein